MMQEGLTGCGEVDQASMIFGCYHGLTVVTRMRCQGRKGEGKGSSRIVKSAFFSARPLFEGIRNVQAGRQQAALRIFDSVVHV